MPQWKPQKDPALFPASWHQLLLQGPGIYTIGFGLNIRGAKALRGKFGAFKACLRANPGRPAGKALQGLEVACRCPESRAIPGYFDVQVILTHGLEAIYSKLKQEEEQV